MPLNLKRQYNFKNLPTSVSYNSEDNFNYFSDCRNVFGNGKRTDTCHGYSNYISGLVGGKVISQTFFKKSDGTVHIIAKCGKNLYSITGGVATIIKTDLIETTKHRGNTFNDLHLVALGSDGYFAFDGNNLTNLVMPTINWDFDINPFVGAGTWPAVATKAKITYYSSAYGLESNPSAEVDYGTPSPNNAALITIYNLRLNTLFDKIRLYISSSGGAFYLDSETPISSFTYGTGSPTGYGYILPDPGPASTITPPTKNASMLEGGAKYLSIFQDREVFAGNQNYPNDVFQSNVDEPIFYDDTTTAETLFSKGNGPLTALATGYYTNSTLAAYLMMAKKAEVEIYSDISSNAQQVKISEDIGCVSQETIKVKNGNIYFLSQLGFRVIANGQFVVDKDGDPATLGNGTIDAIFRDADFDYAVNRNKLDQAHSVFYPTLDFYMTWLPEGTSDEFRKCYVYQFNQGGFTVFDFGFNCTSSCLAEDSEGDPIVLMGDADGNIWKYSTKEKRNFNGSAIEAWARLQWIDPEDLDSTYNYRTVIIKATNSENDIQVRAYVGYDDGPYDTHLLKTEFPSTAFQLDVSQLDVGYLGNESGFNTASADINRVGRSLKLEFYQKVLNESMGLIAVQLDANKNGNRNV